MPAAARTLALDTARGAAIGAVEIVPGVSGGTVALVVGVYERLIDSAGHLARAVVAGVRPSRRTEARAAWRAVEWSLLLPLAVGMLVAVVTAAALLAPLVEDHPVETRAVFAGLVVASVGVPARMVGHRWGRRELAFAAVGAAVALVVTGLPAADAYEPAWYVVVGAAAVAVCALVVPGMSGSFVLLTVGMYAPTLAAVNDRDLAYLGLFVTGAVLGLGSFVGGLRWLLEHRRAPTLALMTGLMVGSLRALWPWQTDAGALQPPHGDALSVLALFLAGVAVVTAVLAVELRASRRSAE